LFRRKKIWITLVLILLFLAPLITLAIWGKRGVEHYVKDKGEKVLGTRFEFSRLDLYPSLGQVVVHDVRVFHPERKEEVLAEVEEMSVRLSAFTSIFQKDKPITIDLRHPKIHFATVQSGEWELAGRIPLIARGEGERRLNPFNIDSISVEEGEIEFRDGRVGPVISLSKVQFKADHWRLPTSQDPLPVHFDGSFFIRNSAQATVKGTGDFLSPQTSLTAELKVKGLVLPPLAPYYEAPLPVRILSGAASFSTKAQVEKDQLKVPLHAEVSGLKVELKKHKAFDFAADMVVDSMKNSRGNVDLDMMIAGDLRRPKFIILTDMNSPIGAVLKQTGREIKEGFKSGWHKFKSIF
jgi:hypothetical protein